MNQRITRILKLTFNMVSYRVSKLAFGFILLYVVLTLGLLTIGYLVSVSTQVKAADDIELSLPIPDNLKVVEDDNNAILTWGDEIKPDKPNPPGVTGYRVTWWLESSSDNPIVQLTSERIIQIQPLTNGQKYQVQVQSVDSMGGLSKPSQLITFTGNPDRVNLLRSQMTGFFDDFNLPSGPFDELKWNQAFSACNDPMMSSSFINAQFHAHNMELSGNCDRAQIINRPRATFDFTGRTGIITFDMDGLTSRSIWYLDLIDKAVGITDINSHVNESGDGEGTPGNVLRIRQNDDRVDLQYVNATGTLTTLATTDSQPYPSLDWIGVITVPNVRRHWEVHVSQHNIEIFVNGKLVLASDLNLPFSQATIHWNAFSYNTAKHNVPYALLHWDNFGFDGPAPTTETHNYITAGYAGRDLLEAVNNVPVGSNINIPDSVDGAVAQRLMFTLQMRDYSEYKWDPNDKVVVNGRDIAVPKPKIASDVQGTGISIIQPYSVVLDLPAATLKTGQNQLSFVMASANLLNIHLELDFAKGSAPTYTQPSVINPDQRAHVMLSMPEVGPAILIDKLDAIDATDYGSYTTKIFPLSGVVSVDISANNDLAMKAMGKNPGISKVQLRLNKMVIYEADPKDAPAFKQVYALDTTKYSNGEYDLDVVAFTKTGAISIPDYFEALGVAGAYFPLKISINNPTSGQIVIPVTKIDPTPGASMTMTHGADHPGMTTGSASTKPVVNSNIPGATSQAGSTLANQSTKINIPQSLRLLLLIIVVYLVVGVLLSLTKGTLRVLNIKSLLNIFIWPLRFIRS